MKKALLFGVLGMIGLGCERLLPQEEASDPFPLLPVKYPATFRDSLAAFRYHDDTLADPYFWLALEESAAVEQWVNEQATVAEAYLRRIPFRQSVERRWRASASDVRFSAPFPAGNAFYLFRRKGREAALCRLSDPYAEPVVVLRPDTFLAGDGRLGQFGFSADGSLLAYEVVSSRTPWRTIRIQDMESGSRLPDELKGVRYSTIAWHKDGFFYSCYPARVAGDSLRNAAEFHQVYYHRVGTGQEEDLLVFADPRYPLRQFTVQTIADERYLLLSGRYPGATGNALYIRDLEEGIDQGDFRVIADSSDYLLELIGQVGGRLLFLTDEGAPRGRLVLVSPRQPDRRYWQQIVPPGADRMVAAYQIGNRIFTVYDREGAHEVQIWSVSGAPGQRVPLPGPGLITGIGPYPGTRSVFLGFHSLRQGEEVLEFDLRRTAWRPYRPATPLPDTAAYAVRQLRYGSGEESRSMYLLYRNDRPPDTSTAAVLYVGGEPGSGLLPILPADDREMVTLLLESGALCAFPVTGSRTGGSRGKWAPAAVNDLLAAAGHLLTRGLAAADRLAVWGSGEGSLLAGAAMVQRPDLFRAFVGDGGPFDMVRYHHLAGGPDLIGRYGSSKRADEYDRLLSYSPVHQTSPGDLPAVLIRPGTPGDGPAPAHAYKWIAVLQDRQRGALPILLSASAGADRLSFLLYQLRQAPMETSD